MKFEEAASPVALLFCTDLMFGVQLQNIARKAGYRPLTLKPGATLPEGAVLVVDLGARGDWEEAIREAAGRGTSVVAFGSHMDGESRKRAKGAGAARVLANSNMARDLPAILMSLQEGGVGSAFSRADDEQEPEQ